MWSCDCWERLEESEWIIYKIELEVKAEVDVFLSLRNNLVRFNSWVERSLEGLRESRIAQSVMNNWGNVDNWGHSIDIIMNNRSRVGDCRKYRSRVGGFMDEGRRSVGDCLVDSWPSVGDRWARSIIRINLMMSIRENTICRCRDLCVGIRLNGRCYCLDESRSRNCVHLGYRCMVRVDTTKIISGSIIRCESTHWRSHNGDDASDRLEFRWNEL